MVKKINFLECFVTLFLMDFQKCTEAIDMFNYGIYNKIY